jgi:hypothetical protein
MVNKKADALIHAIQDAIADVMKQAGYDGYVNIQSVASDKAGSATGIIQFAACKAAKKKKRRIVSNLGFERKD